VVDWGLWQYIYFLSWRLAGLGLKIDLVSITVETSLAALAAVRGKAIVSGIWQLKIVWNCYLCCGASCLSKWHRLYLDFLSAHHESESRSGYRYRYSTDTDTDGTDTDTESGGLSSGQLA